MIGRGRIHLLRAHYEAAREAYRPVVALIEKTGDPWLERIVTNHVAVIEMCLGNFTAAMASAQRSLELCRRYGDRAREGDALSVAGIVLLEVGLYDQAAATFGEALEILSRTASRWSRADCLIYAGVCDVRRGYHQGLALLDEALAEARRLGARYLEANALVARAGAQLRRGVLAAAIEDAADGTAVAQQATLVGYEIQGLARHALALARRGGQAAEAGALVAPRARPARAPAVPRGLRGGGLRGVRRGPAARRRRRPRAARAVARPGAGAAQARRARRSDVAGGVRGDPRDPRAPRLTRRRARSGVDGTGDARTVRKPTSRRPAMETTTEQPQNLDDLIDELNDLIRLDFDAVRAYDQAIEKIEDDDARDDLQQFKLDHERHITDLSEVVRSLGGTPEDGPDLKGVLLEGMTALRSVTGTLGALKAMRMNEKLTNRTYAKAVERPMPEHVRDVVMKNREDERRHLIGIKAHIARLEEEVGEAYDEEEEDLLAPPSTEVHPGAAP